MQAALDLHEEILELKKARNAIILAHNYQTGDIQDIADYVGDSLGLAYQAKDTEAEVIVFCGGALYGGNGKDREPVQDRSAA